MDRSRITDDYLGVLGLERTEPTLSLLGEITSRHVGAFAFSSVGPRLGEELPLDRGSLHERIVVRRRGGYCFEQNGLLFEVLQELGFTVHLHLARVVYNQDVHPGLTHRVSVVEVEGDRQLVDVGFGPLGPRYPVPMQSADPWPGRRSFRVVEPRPGEFHLQTLKDGEPYSLYRFELARYGQADCEVGHFYSHRHPAAVFVNNLVVSRILEGEVRSLRNRHYLVMRDEGTDAREIVAATQLHDLLQDAFGLRVTSAESRRLFDELPPT